MTGTTLRSADFLNTLGVNTHIPYTDGGYANIANIDADLKYLGITEVRDTISNGYAGSAPLSSYITLAKEGVKFTICLFSGGAVTTADLTAQLALVAALNTAVPGSVIAVEGANEINNFPITYNGVGGLAGAVALQTAIYAAVKADTALKGVSVDYFTGYAAGSDAVGPNPATTAGLADYDTQHPYPNQGEAPYQWVNRTQALGNETPATGAAVYTETGYSTNGGTTGDVNQDVQAKYTLDLLMDDAASGIAHTDLYQLMDAYAAGSAQGDDGFGLFDPSNAPKEAATAIHNLTTILADTGATASTFTLAPVAYTLTNLPSTGHTLEIQKSNGASDIVVWNEPAIWDEATGTEVTAPTTNVTVQLGATYKTVEVFDPLKGTTAIETLTNVSSVTLGVTDHPLIVEVEPGTTTTTPPVTTPPVTTPPVTTPPVTTPPVTTTGTITLNIAEDAWVQNVRYEVSVDGKEVGGLLIASTLQSDNHSSVLTLTGDWGLGTHDVALTFINDAYGGTATEDRNLYVNGIAFDGVTYAGTSKEMNSDGTDNFTVGGSTPIGKAPSDELTISLSGDASGGNPAFTLIIDGKAATTAQSVAVAHSSGLWQSFDFSGDFGAGKHTIAVQLDTAGRDLYVNGIDLNGTHYGAGVVEMKTISQTSFTVTTTA
jgi:serralysin